MKGAFLDSNGEPTRRLRGADRVLKNQQLQEDEVELVVDVETPESAPEFVRQGDLPSRSSSSTYGPQDWAEDWKSSQFNDNIEALDRLADAIGGGL